MKRRLTPATLMALMVFAGAAVAIRASAHEVHATHPAEHAGPAHVTAAWSPTVPPGITTRAAYFSLENTAGLPLTVVRAESPDFATAIIHQTSTHDSLTSMAPVDQLTVEAGRSVEFVPHGLHVMLTDASRNYREGDSFPLRLILDDGTTVAFEVTVRKMGGFQEHEHHDHSSPMPEG